MIQKYFPFNLSLATKSLFMVNSLIEKKTCDLVIGVCWFFHD